MLSLVNSPASGSQREIEAFAALQSRLVETFLAYRDLPDAEHALVVVPSMTFDREMLQRVAGIEHYEERLLALLCTLRRPRQRLVYCSSMPISETVVDYYLHLISGVPQRHSRARLTMISCDDASPSPLTLKLLERPTRIADIRRAIAGARYSSMICQNSTDLERSLAVAIGVPLYANPPELDRLGSKSGSREVFREAGVDLPDGFENLRDMDDVAHAVAQLKTRHPALARAVIKVEEGFSGEGNAVLPLDSIDAPHEAERLRQVKALLPVGMQFVASTGYEEFVEKYEAMGGIVEEFIDGDVKNSPSSQGEIWPSGLVRPLSTHDQILGGADGQVFEGSTFPANPEYRMRIQADGQAVGEVLQRRGAVGRYAVDFMVAQTGDVVRHVAIEINLRRGGTTHPMMALEVMTNGSYDPASGQFITQSGRVRTYSSTDNRKHPNYRRLSADDFMDLMVTNHINYDSVTETGAVFHMLGALSQYGKFGMTCIGENLAEARHIDYTVTSLLNRATGVGDA
jgi:hypothetical protein